MRSSIQYAFFDQYVKRIPLFDVDTLKKFSEQQTQIDVLTELLSDPIIREAIYLSSPIFLKEWDKGKRNEKILNTAFKYVIRMSSRCIPFGLFASPIICSFQSDSDAEETDATRKTQLDFNVVKELYKSVNEDSNLYQHITYEVNDTLFKLGNTYNYIQSRVQSNSFLEYKMYDIEESENLNLCLETAAEHPTFFQLVKVLNADGYDQEDAQNFIKSLIENQILIPVLRPDILEPGNLNRIIRFLSGMPDYKSKVNTLSEIQYNLQKLDKEFGNPISLYSSISEKLNTLGIQSNSRSDFHVMYSRNSCSSIKSNEHDKRIIREGIDALMKIAQKAYNKDYIDFTSAYIDHYQEAPVRLVTALNPTLGIGYPCNSKFSKYWYLEDIQTEQSNELVAQDFPKLPLDNLLMEKLNSTDEYEIELTNKELDRLKIKTKLLAPTLSVITEKIDLRNGAQKYFLPGISGSTAGSTIGRFGYLNNQFSELLENIAMNEEEVLDEYICAEIAHIPGNTNGNIALRINSRRHRLNYLSGSSSTTAKHIDINQLFLCHDQGELYITVGKHGKRLMPFSTCAHNSRRSSLPVYKFLADYYDNRFNSTLQFSWGRAGINRVFLPRVTYKNCVLHKARWIFSREYLKHIIEPEDLSEAIVLIKTLRSKWNIPKYVNIKEGDRYILIDLDNSDFIRLLLSEIKNKKQVILEEELSHGCNQDKSKMEGPNQHIYFLYREN